MHTLKPLFASAWHDAGACTDGTALCDALLAAYAEPHRHYHSTQHLAECLQGFEAVRHLAQRPAEVALALWFHDAVYDVKRHDNETPKRELGPPGACHRRCAGRGGRACLRVGYGYPPYQRARRGRCAAAGGH